MQWFRPSRLVLVGTHVVSVENTKYEYTRCCLDPGGTREVVANVLLTL